MAVPQVLGRLQRGMDRTRVRGDADVSSLYNLVNAYVTTAGRSKKRPGFTVVTGGAITTLDPATRGLFSAGGKLHTFYSVDAVVALPGVEHHRLVPPTAADGTVPALVAVHFASLYLGGLYVVAEFEGGLVCHYWLQTQQAWAPNTVYFEGQLVRPLSAETGFYYQPTTSVAPSAWQPNTVYKVGDAVQPKIYNGYQYIVLEADGDNPTSGATEPAWVATEGAQVYEDIDNTPKPVPPTTNGGTPGGDRYNNLPGYKQRQLDGLE